MYKDKDLYKRKNDNISKLEQIRNNEVKLTAAFLALLLSIQGTLCLTNIKNELDYQLKPINPFNGSAISSDFIANYQAMKANKFICDEEFKDVIEHIKNSDIDEKKAYVLYYALLENKYLTAEEKEKLTGYIQYFIDNKYLDYEYVYNKLALFKINPNDETLHDFGAAGIYNRGNNSMTFANDSDRDYALSHEILHSEDKSGDILSYHDYAWFIEGLTCVLNYEYLNNKSDGENIKAYFVRLLCELVDPDILFKVRTTGNINILINELENKGAKRDTVLELFKLFNDYNYLKEEEKTINGYANIIHEIIKKEISIRLIEIYNSVYNNPDFIKPIYFDYILEIESDGISSNIISTEMSLYYFNSLKKGEKTVIEKNGNFTYFIKYEDLKRNREVHLSDGVIGTSITYVTQDNFTIKYNNSLKMLEELKEKNNSKFK